MKSRAVDEQSAKWAARIAHITRKRQGFADSIFGEMGLLDSVWGEIELARGKGMWGGLGL
jgi:hypothetical protein